MQRESSIRGARIKLLVELRIIDDRDFVWHEFFGTLRMVVYQSYYLFSKKWIVQTDCANIN